MKYEIINRGQMGRSHFQPFIKTTSSLSKKGTLLLPPRFQTTRHNLGPLDSSKEHTMNARVMPMLILISRLMRITFRYRLGHLSHYGKFELNSHTRVIHNGFPYIPVQKVKRCIVNN